MKTLKMIMIEDGSEKIYDNVVKIEFNLSMDFFSQKIDFELSTGEKLYELLTDISIIEIY